MPHTRPATILLTGFDPFGGETINPSWEVVRSLHGSRIGDATVVAVQVPCVFGEAIRVMREAVAAHQPVLVLAMGQAGGRPDITLERVAINVDDARIPDNAGKQPIDEPVNASGPAAYFSTLPIKAMVAGLRAAGIPASVSQSAGTFVCNHVFYGLMDLLAGRTDCRGGFMHIPFLPQQACQHPGAPSMKLEDMIEAVRVALSVALVQRGDVKVEGGAVS
ncbi:pyroglutamyl-peptidase I [Burkholderiaceae bacterium DAT-1]|nr:pyroglutamyl-peptidase I [Burkholderiaceae bacterium DAT-1]